MKPTLFLISLLFILTVAASGCLEEAQETISGGAAALSVEPSKVEMKSGELSDFVSATVTQQANDSQSYIIKFPQTLESAYPVDADGSRISELSTKQLAGKGSKELVQFKVKASIQEAKSATYELELELWQGETQIKSQTKKLEVVVKA